MITEYSAAQTRYAILQRVIDRVRDEGVPDTVPNLWDEVAASLTEITGFLRHWRGQGHNHADGFYTIGFQRLFGAPPHVQQAVERYHAELRRARGKARR